MSLNICIYAVTEAMIIKTGEVFDHVVELFVWQTPTKVSRRIMNSENKMEEYENYVFSISDNEQIPVFAEDDIFCEGDPIGYRLVNMGKEHLEELQNDVAHYENRGYEIVFEIM